MKTFPRALALSAALAIPAVTASAEAPRMALENVQATVSTQADEVASGAEFLPIIVAVAIMLIAANAGSSSMAYPAVTASDERLKTGIERIGVSPSGIPVYQFSYKGLEGRYNGDMAQDLLTLAPDAVATHEAGFYVVDYARIDVDFMRID